MMRGEEDGHVSPVHKCEYIISFVSHPCIIPFICSIFRQYTVCW